VSLRALQVLALGGEHGGAATYVAEHWRQTGRGSTTSYDQTTATLGMFWALLVIRFGPVLHGRKGVRRTGMARAVPCFAHSACLFGVAPSRAWSLRGHEVGKKRAPGASVQSGGKSRGYSRYARSLLSLRDEQITEIGLLRSAKVGSSPFLTKAETLLTRYWAGADPQQREMAAQPGATASGLAWQGSHQKVAEAPSQSAVRSLRLVSPEGRARFP